MLLECLCRTPAEPVDLPVVKDAAGVWRTDWEPLLDVVSDEQRTRASRAGVLHATMAAIVLQQAQKVRDEHSFAQVALCGGVFQNRALTEQAVELLQDDGFNVYLPEKLPCNDAALSFGQAVEIAARRGNGQ